MEASRSQELLILNVPDFLVSPPSDVRHKLTEPPVGISFAEFLDSR
jgi:hypothetical protein